MLIDFSVANFRSFRERQTLSMVAAPRLPRRANTFAPILEGDPVGELLKVAVIYGPNASGKSNLIKAFDALRNLVVNKPSASANDLPVSSFRFDPALANEPSEFEINFITSERRFRLSVAATTERIVREQLCFFPKGKESLLYERDLLDGREHYKFGALLEGNESLHETWRNLTGARNLFLSQVAANSSEDLTQLKIPYRWLDANLMHVPAGGGMKIMTRVLQLIYRQYKDEAVIKKLPFMDVVPFVRDLDIPITNFQFEASEIDPSAIGTDDKKSIEDALRSGEIRATLTHATELGSAGFKFDEESEGTQNLIGFFVFWETLRNQIRDLLLIDEFDSSLHPQIVAQLVKKHLALPQPRQLVFTTHDTHLMDAKIVRRDQIWLTERNKFGATQLRSVHDFEGRESEDIEKRYYEGRYRGLPILRDL